LLRSPISRLSSPHNLDQQHQQLYLTRQVILTISHSSIFTPLYTNTVKIKMSTATTMVNTIDTPEVAQADTIRETMSVNNLLADPAAAPDVTANPPALAPPSTPTRQSTMKEEAASPDTVMSDAVSLPSYCSSFRAFDDLPPCELPQLLL
jgi:hypothetical protein